MYKVILILLLFSNCAICQIRTIFSNLPENLIPENELVECGYRICEKDDKSWEDCDTIYKYCLNNKPYTGVTFALSSSLDFPYNFNRLKVYSNGFLSLMMLYDRKEGWMDESIGYIQGWENPVWSNMDACEEGTPIEYFIYWDNGNIKEHGMEYCDEKIGLISEYDAKGNIQKITYYPFKGLAGEITEDKIRTPYYDSFEPASIFRSIVFDQKGRGSYYIKDK